MLVWYTTVHDLRIQARSGMSRWISHCMFMGRVRAPGCRAFFSTCIIRDDHFVWYERQLTNRSKRRLSKIGEEHSRTGKSGCFVEWRPAASSGRSGQVASRWVVFVSVGKCVRWAKVASFARPSLRESNTGHLRHEKNKKLRKGRTMSRRVR